MKLTVPGLAAPAHFDDDAFDEGPTAQWSAPQYAPLVLVLDGEDSVDESDSVRTPPSQHRRPDGKQRAAFEPLHRMLSRLRLRWLSFHSAR